MVYPTVQIFKQPFYILRLLFSEPNYNLSGRKWAPVTAEEISTGRITWLVLRNQPEFVEEPVRDRMLLWKQIEEVLETGVIPTTDG